MPPMPQRIIYGGGITTMSRILRSVAIFLIALMSLSGVANAQWVTLGRKALGKIKQLTSEATEPSGQQSERDTKNAPQPGYDAATVLLEARADKVYGAAINILQANKDMRITKKDDKALTIEFTDGKLAAGMQVSSLGDNISQLLVVSTKTGKAGTSIVLNGIMRVCREMGVHCQTADE